VTKHSPATVAEIPDSAIHRRVDTPKDMALTHAAGEPAPREQIFDRIADAREIPMTA